MLGYLEQADRYRVLWSDGRGRRIEQLEGRRDRQTGNIVCQGKSHDLDFGEGGADLALTLTPVLDGLWYA